MEDDRLFLQKSIETAKAGIINGGGPFGAVITRENTILSVSYNKVVSTHDPTAHAEVLAIREAASFLGSHDLQECTLYASCEPCPMCLGAIYWSGIKKVVYASDRRDAEAAGFNDKLIYDELFLHPGKRKISFVFLEEPGAKEVFNSWIKYENKIPY